MRLTRRKRYLFRIDTRPTSLVNVFRISTKGLGAIVLLLSSSAIGWLYGQITIPFIKWCGDVMLDNGLVVFLLLFGCAIIVVIATYIMVLINVIFRIHHPTVIVLCCLTSTALLTVNIVTNNHEARAIGFAIFFFVFFLACMGFAISQSERDEQYQLQKVKRALHRIKDQTVLMSIVCDTHDEQTALEAIKGIDADNCAYFHEVANTTKFASVCKYACKMSGHDWDGCVCRCCGNKRNSDHDFVGCVCQRCGEKRDVDHDFVDCVCTKCGEELHDLDDRCVCRRCGVEEHDWQYDGEYEGTIYQRCSRCGACTTKLV